MDGEPLISIGMPAFEGEKTIVRALDSLLAQEYENIELIISDNASTDRTLAICQEYAAKDPRILLIKNQKNLGAMANFGLVLSRAHGPYFMWGATDDWWAPGFVTNLAQELREHEGAGVAMCAVKRVREDGAVQDIVRYEGSRDPNKMSNLKLANALMDGEPYHLFIYGLFRTGFLREAFRDFPNVKAGDRLFMTRVALSTKFRYVDQILHVRQVSDVPIPVRYENGEIGKAWKGPNADLKRMLLTGPYLMRSKVIPWQRKLLIPAIVTRHLLMSLYRRVSRFDLYGRACNLLYVLSGKLLGKGGRKTVARYIRRLLSGGSTPGGLE